MFNCSSCIGLFPGPDGQVTEGCFAADLDENTDVDLHDFGVPMTLLGV